MIGIIGAMDMEVDGLKEQMSSVEIHTISGMDFYQGFLRYWCSSAKRRWKSQCGYVCPDNGVAVSNLYDYQYWRSGRHWQGYVLAMW